MRGSFLKPLWERSSLNQRKEMPRHLVVKKLGNFHIYAFLQKLDESFFTKFGQPGKRHHPKRHPGGKCYEKPMVDSKDQGFRDGVPE